MSSKDESRLANSRSEWLMISRAETSPFIRSLADWDAFIASKRVDVHVLSALDSVSLKNFRDQLKFIELSVNGKPVKRCCISWYYGDLIQRHKFNQDQIIEVAALFGIGPDHFHAQADKFGDLCDDEVCCRARVAYNCPDGAGDCTC
jgi:hypothetical protein